MPDPIQFTLASAIYVDRANSVNKTAELCTCFCCTRFKNWEAGVEFVNNEHEWEIKSMVVLIETKLVASVG